MTIKISAMSAAMALGGTEKIECVQSSATAYLTPAQIETYIAGLGRTFAKDAGLWWPLASSAVGVSCPADTSEDILATITVPAGAIGANGQLRIWQLWSCTNNANSKTMRVRLGGVSGTQFLNAGVASIASWQNVTIIRNRNSQSSQIGYANNQGTPFAITTTTNQTGAVDTSASQDIVISGQKGTAGDALTLEAYMVELYYKA